MYIGEEQRAFLEQKKEEGYTQGAAGRGSLLEGNGCDVWTEKIGIAYHPNGKVAIEYTPVIRDVIGISMRMERIKKVFASEKELGEFTSKTGIRVAKKEPLELILKK